ncbi:MAG: 2,3-bisphosphoglycerate-independent phosphoglycerate mutase [Pseudomonadales bacterium]|nr:2,3-bisphosphoglycerate-independent phosphoglycerate mutase [Pseudomonadales bacterium]NRA17219.1 2,3-bisphosphoglycerate-independent phosphoglycerate mutase [Oceanospirillaceae bacterium]
MTGTSIPTALIILDGFGIEITDSSAIAAANTPIWDKLMAQNPNSLIETSGTAVGLPDGQMGNSEVGHMNIGAGRIVYQNLTRITKAISDGSFNKNSVLIAAMDKAIASGGAIHFSGLLSPGGVHSHEQHCFAAIRMAVERGAKRVYLHAILDGRDMPPRSAQSSLQQAQQLFSELAPQLEEGGVATVVGRYFAMDRDNRWDRVERAYNAMAHARAEYRTDTAVQALQDAYERGENDEFVSATCINGLDGRVTDADSLICFNFRPDRSREITRAFVEPGFDRFPRAAKIALSDYVMLTQYAADIPASCAYLPSPISNDIGEYVSSLGKTQLRIAETEKYAHVTFFFNGGQESEYPGEKRILVPSPDVATYDLQPEMSAPEVTEKLCAAIRAKEFDLIICNFANPDMVGHTGVFSAAVEAVEAVDLALGKVLAAMREVQGETLVTADHGNVEMMLNPETGQAHTSHTIFPVGLVYDGPKNSTLTLSDGALCDLAPTLLELMGLAQPNEMTGASLVKKG